jgi:aspartate/methionine/tyrosine aminotransferase
MIATAPRVGRLAPTAVNAILADVRRVQATGKSVVSLMRGEPDFPTPSHISDAAVAALRAGRTGYPDNRGEQKFREAVT